jgi:isoquinoline 1-oxidoreductase alpha subunit
MAQYAFTVNGKRHSVEALSDTPLLWLLRDNLGLTGTKFGCGVGMCGACSILEGSNAVRSCMITAAQAQGNSFTTIEGLSPDGTHACQSAWIEEDVAQCGYCQPGMIITAAALLSKHPSPSDNQIEEAMAANLCRCGTYQRIRSAVQRAARRTA